MADESPSEHLMFLKTYWGVSPVIINVASQKQTNPKEQIKNSGRKGGGSCLLSIQQQLSFSLLQGVLDRSYCISLSCDCSHCQRLLENGYSPRKQTLLLSNCLHFYQC